MDFGDRIHMRPKAGQPGAVPPRNFKNDDVICFFRVKYHKISLASLTLEPNTFKLSQKRRNNSKKFRLRLGCAQKSAIFVSPRGFAPLETFIRAPMIAFLGKKCLNFAKISQNQTFYLKK